MENISDKTTNTLSFDMAYYMTVCTSILDKHKKSRGIITQTEAHTDIQGSV